MNKDKVLEEIFNNDPYDILKVKPKVNYVSSENERLMSSFYEINEFFEKYNREPNPNIENVNEYQLYSRLKSIREDESKKEILFPIDKHSLLNFTHREINSLDDILNDDSFGLLGDVKEEGLYDFKHIPRHQERDSADFVARRKPCKDFSKYEQTFKDVQKDLSEGKRKTLIFRMGNLKEGNFYVHKGILFYLESIEFTRKEHYKEDGTRVREDGRTRCIFENGTESNMLFRSVSKSLYADGYVVTHNTDKVNEKFIESFHNITDEDAEAGYIYVLKSNSKDEKIRSISNLYKIGYSKMKVEDRIKNAEKDPTYFMAPVKIIGTWKCYNMNPQKFEQLLHNFFGSSCLNFDIYDAKGLRHIPREWFIVPIGIIEQVIELIVDGQIVNYRYDTVNSSLVMIKLE